VVVWAVGAVEEGWVEEWDDNEVVVVWEAEAWEDDRWEAG